MNLGRLVLTVAACAALNAIPSVGLADQPDEVLLLNGGRLRGKVMEDDPAQGVSIQLLDGTVRRVSRVEISRVQYAGAGQLPAAVPAPVAVAPLGEPAWARPYEPVPGVRRTKSLRPLWITGLALWGATYIATIAVTAAVAEDDAGKYAGEAAVPIAGPFIVLADGEPSDGQTAALIASGVIQTLSATMFVLGLSIRVPDNSAKVVPLPVAKGSGLAIVGTF
jgi:hypothetical protein